MLCKKKSKMIQKLQNNRTIFLTIKMCLSNIWRGRNQSIYVWTMDGVIICFLHKCSYAKVILWSRYVTPSARTNMKHFLRSTVTPFCMLCKWKIWKKWYVVHIWFWTMVRVHTTRQYATATQAHSCTTKLTRFIILNFSHWDEYICTNISLKIFKCYLVNTLINSFIQAKTWRPSLRNWFANSPLSIFLRKNRNSRGKGQVPNPKYIFKKTKF